MHAGADTNINCMQNTCMWHNIFLYFVDSKHCGSISLVVVSEMLRVYESVVFAAVMWKFQKSFLLFCFNLKFSFSMFFHIALLVSVLRFSCHFVSLHLRFCLPIFRCPLISHVLITTSSSVFLPTCPNHNLLLAGFSNVLTYVCHTCPCSYFSIPWASIHNYEHTRVLSNKSCSNFFFVQVSLSYIKTGLMTK